MMSEAELHVLKERMYQGKLNKARRGELFGTPPIGYVRLPSGEWAIDPDEQVQAVVRLIFDEFDRQGTLHGLLRYLVAPQHPHPGPADLAGPNRGQLEWRRPNRVTLQNLLHHPIYAGAYRYGHRAADPRRKRAGPARHGPAAPPAGGVPGPDPGPPARPTSPGSGSRPTRIGSRPTGPGNDRPGAPRQGPSLLGGLLRCGRCGRRMLVRYAGPKARLLLPLHARVAATTPSRCASGSPGGVLDGLVREQILAAVAPAALEASLAAVAEVERERSDWPGSGSCGWSGRGTRPSGRRGSTRRASRRTASWAASWSGGGRRR